MTLAQLNNVVDQLKSTSSLTGKQKILAANRYDGLLRKMLQFVYDPNVVTGISNKKLEKWVAPVKIAGDSPTSIFSNLLDYLKEHNTGRDNDVGLCQYAIEQAGQYGQLVRDVVTKSLTVGCQAKMLNKVYGDDFIPKWEVQQAYPIDTAKLKKGEWFSLSEKLNGIRGTYYKGRIISRQGQEIAGLDHIIKAIQDAGYGYYVLDGELRRRNIDHIPDNENFRIGTGIINSDGDKSCIDFTIFDILTILEWENELTNTYRLRRDRLKGLESKLAAMPENTPIKVVPLLYEGTDTKMIDVMLDKMVAEDKEGCMLNRDTPYQKKRNKGILKVKRFYTCDLQVLRLEEGQGRLAGTLGAFVVDYKGNELSVGSGMTDEQREQFWASRDNLIGRIIEVKYKEVSKDKKTGKESLQFPIFVGLREIGKEVSYG